MHMYQVRANNRKRTIGRQAVCATRFYRLWKHEPGQQMPSGNLALPYEMINELLPRSVRDRSPRGGLWKVSNMLRTDLRSRADF